MKPLALVAALALAALELASSPRAAELPRGESLRLVSPRMPRAVKVRMWLPPGFDAAPPGSIPLLVFLHDGFGSERSFARRGLAEILAGIVARGEVEPFAVACPRTVGTFNSNDRQGKRPIFDLLTDDLVPFLLDHYPQLRRDAAGRGITGISLGGYGSLKLAMRRPGLFPSVSALSPWIEDLSFARQQELGWFLRWALGRVFGATPETSTVRNESLFVVLREGRDPALPLPRWLIVTGNDDPSALDGNLARLETDLLSVSPGGEVKRYSGAHDWAFWKARFPEIARFHAARFAASRP